MFVSNLNQSMHLQTEKDETCSLSDKTINDRLNDLLHTKLIEENIRSEVTSGPFWEILILYSYCNEVETYRVVRGADGYETITVQKQQTRARSNLCGVDRVAHVVSGSGRVL